MFSINKKAVIIGIAGILLFSGCSTKNPRDSFADKIKESIGLNPKQWGLYQELLKYKQNENTINKFEEEWFLSREHEENRLQEFRNDYKKDTGKESPF